MPHFATNGICWRNWIRTSVFNHYLSAVYQTARLYATEQVQGVEPHSPDYKSGASAHNALPADCAGGETRTHYLWLNKPPLMPLKLLQLNKKCPLPSDKRLSFMLV